MSDKDSSAGPWSARSPDAPVGLRRKYQPGEIHPITCEHCAARMNGHAGYYAACPSCGNANLLSQYEQPNQKDKPR